jgi:hypothetical protein
MDLLDGLLRILEESDTLVKIFISSRENMDVFERLESKPNVRIGAKDNAEDIAKFVQRQLKVANLIQGKLPAFLKEKIPEVLIEGVQGMFRWVDLQIQSLRPLKIAVNIDDRLGRLPETLEESYFEMFDQIAKSGAHAFGLAIFTFQWLLYARKSIAILVIPALELTTDECVTEVACTPAATEKQCIDSEVAMPRCRIPKSVSR